jgi:hypothetical protein
MLKNFFRIKIMKTPDFNGGQPPYPRDFTLKGP